MKEELLDRVRRYVTDQYDREAPAYLYYHNLLHTEAVVQHILEIGRFYDLDGDLLRTLSVAGWFHDIGHLYTVPEEHEYKSVSIMRSFLAGLCDDATIEAIERLILATRMPTHPSSLLEEIICDADTYNLGTNEFPDTDRRVKKEMESRTGAVFTAWTERALHLLQHHHFFTSYCRERLQEGKRANIAYLERQLSTPEPS